ncbi:hypothetical protein ABWK22_02490 [Gottfriedia acidiceleris]|uniref:hypothetical protein n=1 Tax=Gottfriedia acidiceleris TaxID=371036 RepID=UPI0033963F60
MLIEKKYKPSFHKANARYRGVTELSQYTNFVLESAHDLLLLGHITEGNEKTNKVGHQKEMYNNFVSIMTGDQEVGKSNLFTASTLQKIDYSRNVPIPTLNSWSPLNGCTMTTVGDAIKLSSNGLQDPVGMYSTLYVEPGEKLYIRMKVRSTGGASDFSFGSINMRKGPESNGDTKKVSLEASNEFKTVDYVLRFQYAESISININVHENPDTLKATNIEVKDLEIYYFNELPVQVSSFDTVIKPNVDELEEKINSIR